MKTFKILIFHRFITTSLKKIDLYLLFWRQNHYLFDVNESHTTKIIIGIKKVNSFEPVLPSITKKDKP